MTHPLKQAVPGTHESLSADKSGAAPPTYWIVVADITGAHIYVKNESGIERVADENSCCTHPFPTVDGIDNDFLHHLAVWLGKAEQEAAFDRLALLGGGETLAFMRRHLPQNANDRVCAALEKEVDEIRENEIEDHLISVVWV
ncbi:MAG: host attachment protein [Alphaproteobacteria bacterium]|nr:host attachment protein [Alphaproteobacteria bacterium]